MRGSQPVYPPEAYAPSGELWWKLTRDPESNRPYGGERKIAAWLAFDVGVGGVFTMRDVRRALGVAGDEPNEAEQLNRRLRNLRPDGWVVYSYRTDASLPVDTYRLEKIGWHPGLGTARPVAHAISASMRRRVIERDGRRCVICGVGRAEPYPGDPVSAAVLTAGHRVPERRESRVRSLDELQAECQRCNETVRDELPDPLTAEEVMPDVRRLGRADRATLLAWLSAGHRLRSRLDEVHDRVRALTPEERATVLAALREMSGQTR